MAYHSPFDLYYWFVNVFAGNELIFIAIAFLVMAMIAGMFRMPTIIFGMLFAAFVLMIGIMTGNLYILILFVVGVIVTLIYMRFAK